MFWPEWTIAKSSENLVITEPENHSMKMQQPAESSNQTRQQAKATKQRTQQQLNGETIRPSSTIGTTKWHQTKQSGTNSNRSQKRTTVAASNRETAAEAMDREGKGSIPDFSDKGDAGLRRPSRGSASASHRTEDSGRAAAIRGGWKEGAELEQGNGWPEGRPAANSSQRISRQTAELDEEEETTGQRSRTEQQRRTSERRRKGGWGAGLVTTELQQQQHE